MYDILDDILNYTLEVVQIVNLIFYTLSHYGKNNKQS